MACEVEQQLRESLLKATVEQSKQAESLKGVSRTLAHFEQSERLSVTARLAGNVYLEHQQSCEHCRVFRVT